jgi:MoaA/NifB/PqqE/SkfB family radical SAM enzyme
VHGVFAQECVEDRHVRTLPLVTLHLTDRCNSRCIACDYRRNGSRDVSLDSVSRLLPSLVGLGTQAVLISGGEPLLHRQWDDIASMLRQSGLRLWLLTSGLSLKKHASRVAQLFDAITVSLDGIDPRMYASVRGVDAFDAVCEGIRAVARAGVAPSVRVTVQRANYAALSQFVALARALDARQISFLAADLGNPNAFGRSAGFAADVALRPDDLGRFEAILGALELDNEHDFRSGFIEESPRKLRRLLEYYAAACGLGDYPPVRCNAPEFSAVVGADGRLSPCFFIPGPDSSVADGNLGVELNSAEMVDLREAIRAGRRPECRTCVCSLWRGAGQATDFIPSSSISQRRAARA